MAESLIGIRIILVEDHDDSRNRRDDAAVSWRRGDGRHERARRLASSPTRTSSLRTF